MKYSTKIKSKMNPKNNNIKKTVMKIEKLEITKRVLLKKLEKLTKEKILPEIEPHIPKPFSICYEKSEIIFTNFSDKNAHCSLDLRILYKGKEINSYSNRSASDELNNLNKELHPLYVKLKQKYNLFTWAFGEPVEFL